MKSKLKWAVMEILGLYLGAMGVIAISGWKSHIASADVGVVLGNQVLPNGQPSLRLAARTRAAADLYKKGLIPKIIVSGAVGLDGTDETLVMKRVLLDEGIPEKQIVRDNLGKNTRFTAQNAARIMREQGWTSAVVISQFYHIPRTRLAFCQAGITPVYDAHPDYLEWRDLYSLAREVPALLVYWIKRI